MQYKYINHNKSTHGLSISCNLELVVVINNGATACVCVP